MRSKAIFLTAVVVGLGCFANVMAAKGANDTSVSGIYPHLAMFNDSGECGVGAVVPWAGKLWVITYGPHMPNGSDDKLYEIDRQLNMTIRPESVGGTPANRLVHIESKQLNIGPYFIDTAGNVRVIPPDVMPGRLTATARHLSDWKNKLYIMTMEEGLYEVDVNTLDVKEIYKDANAFNPADADWMPGYHGKGGYSGQGKLFYSNNGEYAKWGDKYEEGPSGCLAEWNGAYWSVLERHQFTEITGPGGIFGNSSIKDPVWATGWDHKSVILRLLDKGKWYRYRLPKGSYTYDGLHGWHTEWPRIRQIGDRQMLMTMHGTMWDFPKGFRAKNSAGIKPLSTYLKIIGDFCQWDGNVVFGCDDASTFANPLVGQSQSNLWFVKHDKLDSFGPRMGFGGVWIKEPVKANEPSTPYLFAGFDKRMVHLKHDNDSAVTFTFEIDRNGNEKWVDHKSVTVDAQGYANYLFDEELAGQWIRIRADKDCNKATAYFHYGSNAQQRSKSETSVFKGIAKADDNKSFSAGPIRPRGEDMGTLHFAAWKVDSISEATEIGYYEIDKDMQLKKSDDTSTHEWLKEKAEVKQADFEVDAASVIVTDEDGKRWRLPKGNEVFDHPTAIGWRRGIREVATERSLFNCHGTFYELPRISSGGYGRMKPVCTHNSEIYDYCSWRGMLVISGCLINAKEDGHCFKSDDGKAGLWFGNIDDLWAMGKPVGKGGPWLDTQVKADKSSDAYLMTGYDRKTMTLSHDAESTVEFTVEVDFLGNGMWAEYASHEVEAGEQFTHEFADGFSAHWVRFTANTSCKASATLIYQ